MTQEIQQEQTERTEMERKTLFPLLAPVKNVAPFQKHMHPLFEKASGLTESIIAAAIEVHRDKGPGLIESIYEWCLTKEFELRRVAMRKPEDRSDYLQGLLPRRTAAVRHVGGRLRIGGSKSHGENSTHPQSATPELHETVGYPDWVAH